eukprot:164448-Rhodomonas_salina.1
MEYSNYRLLEYSTYVHKCTKLQYRQFTNTIPIRSRVRYYNGYLPFVSSGYNCLVNCLKQRVERRVENAQ